jgi:hypothetical protein
MADLPNLLVASLKPDTRKQAEQALNAISTQPGFLGVLLQLVLNSTQERPVRLAASIYLKNIAKMRWDEVSQPIFANFSLKLKLCVGGPATSRTGQDSTERSTGACHACSVQSNGQDDTNANSGIRVTDC